MRTVLALVVAISFLKLISTGVSAYDSDSTFDPKTSFFIPNFMGKVKTVRGNVFAGDRELGKGSKVYRNDLIKTADKSFMILELIDLTEITIGPNSEFKVEKWAYRTNNDRDAVISVIKGQMRAHVKSKTKYSEQIQFKTPMVSLGVRGTELLINVVEQLHKEITQVALLEGMIHLYGNDAIEAQDLKPGQHLVLTKTADGFERQNKMLTKEEMQSGVFNLLGPIASNEIMVDKNAYLEKKAESFNSEDIRVNDQKLKPWRETLKELNQTWHQRK